MICLPGKKIPNPEKVKFLTAFFDEILGDTGSLTKLERALLEAEFFAFYRKEEPPTLSRSRLIWSQPTTRTSSA